MDKLGNASIGGRRKVSTGGNIICTDGNISVKKLSALGARLRERDVGARARPERNSRAIFPAFSSFRRSSGDHSTSRFIRITANITLASRMRHLVHGQREWKQLARRL